MILIRSNELQRELKTDYLHCPKIGLGYIKDGDKHIVMKCRVKRKIITIAAAAIGCE